MQTYKIFLMSPSFIIVFVSLVILVLIAMTFVFFYFRALQHEIHDSWLLVIKKMRLRLDKLPNVIETIRSATKEQEAILQEIIKLRSQSWPIETASANKVNLELEISDKLHALWDLPMQFPKLHQNTNFLSLKNEFKEIGETIEQLLETYNGKIRRYNGLLQFALLKLFFLIFRFKKMPIFEFET